MYVYFFKIQFHIRFNYNISLEEAGLGSKQTKLALSNFATLNHACSTARVNVMLTLGLLNAPRYSDLSLCGYYVTVSTCVLK